MVEKLSVSFWFIASIAVMMPIKAMMPKAIMATVIPLRSLLLRTVRKAKEKTSEVFIKNGFTKLANPLEMTFNSLLARLKVQPVGKQVRENAQQDSYRCHADQCIFKAI